MSYPEYPRLPETITDQLSQIQAKLGALSLTVEGEVAVHAIGSADDAELLDARDQLEAIAKQCTTIASTIPGVRPVLKQYVDPEMLFKKLIPLSMVPGVEFPEGGAGIPITVTRDRHLRVFDIEHNIYGNRLCLFNSLLLVRDRWVSGSQLRSIGFDTRTSKGSGYFSCFIRPMNHIADLRPDVRHPIIESEMRGKEKYYRLNEAIVLKDMR